MPVRCVVCDRLEYILNVSTAFGHPGRGATVQPDQSMRHLGGFGWGPCLVFMGFVLPARSPLRRGV